MIFDFNNLVETYEFNESCQGSCAQSFFCFLISSNEEDTIRNCIAIGCDCDTTGAMAGAIAEAFYSKDDRSQFEKEFIDKMIGDSLVEFADNFRKVVKEYY